MSKTRATTMESDGRISVVALGARIRTERSDRRLTLEDLASLSGVSRSMLSAIERGTKVPTVIVLDRVANALGVSVSRLLDEERPETVVVLRRDDQKLVSGDGWERHIVSPVVHGVDFEMGRVQFAPGADAGEFAPHLPGWTEYFVVERGTVEITLDRRRSYILNTGDSLYFQSDVTHSFRNPGTTESVGYVVQSASGARRSR